MDLDLVLSILVILVVISLASFGGHVSSEKGYHKKLFWIIGAIGVLIMICQTVRQRHSQQQFQAQVNRLEAAGHRVSDLQNDITAKQVEIDKRQVEIAKQSEENVRLSNIITQQADTAIKTVTGGNSICYMRLMMRNDGVYPLVLSKGQYPIYDLTFRLWNPGDWNSDSPSLGSLLTRVNSETSKLGTLPMNDYIEMGRLPLPSGNEAHYAAEFSARNGSWSQTIVLRQAGKGWKVATLLRKSARVVTFRQLNETPKPICYEADEDFPEQTPGELKHWTKGATKCDQMH